MDIKQAVLRAEGRIRPWVRTTPLEPSPYFSTLGQSQVYFKLENLQHTGSFKLRGALNKLKSLTATERKCGCVTASTGNHGAAVAYGLQQMPDTRGLVFVPENAAETKVAAIKRLGAEVRFHGSDGVETETFARQYASQNGMVFISPYNDAQVLAGQGTIGLELSQQLERVDAVFVALGGGGLISGIAGYLKAVQPQVQIIGCSPQNSAVMIESIKANHILDLASQPTLSDGTAGGLEPDSITFGLCRSLVDDYITVSEAEIRAAMISFMEAHHLLIEGAAGVAIAAYLKQAKAYAGKNVVIIICGANISLATLKQILNGAEI